MKIIPYLTGALIAGSLIGGCTFRTNRLVEKVNWFPEYNPNRQEQLLVADDGTSYTIKVNNKKPQESPLRELNTSLLAELLTNQL